MRRIARRGWRQLSVLVSLLLALSFLIRSLFVMQVLQAGNAQMLAHYRDEVSSPQTEQPVRGTIVDANGLPLVNTVTVFKLGAYPYLVQDKARTARAIANIISPPQAPQNGGKKAAAAAHHAYKKLYNAILAQLQQHYTYVCLAGDDSYTCPLRDDISTQQAEQIGKLQNMPGLDLEPRNRPNYPNGPLAAHVLGFVNYAYPNGQAVDQGRYGLEEYYNSLLRGISGRVAVRQDTAGDAIRVGPGSNTAAQQGAQLRLYLDSYIQYQVEQILFQTVQRWGAQSGTAIVERPSDGAILAMASWPRYDPGKWQDILKADPKNGFLRFQNPAVSEVYEPGSTFKSILAAIGLDSGSFTASTPVDDITPYQTDGYTVNNWCLNYCALSYNRYGGYQGTVQDMLHWSSNIAATRFAQMIQPVPLFYDYLRRFGFEQPTGVDLAAEIGGHFIDPNSRSQIWVPQDRDTIAYGQGIQVTPLELINAYAALANGGKLMVPHVVQLYTLDGKTVTTQPQVRRQVIQPDVADEVSSILVHASVNGEACPALVPGYDVAAKTGTSTIYGSSATIASTAAFGPVNMPPNKQFVVLVVLHKPSNPYGSETAAPAVHQILQLLFTYYHLQPNQPYWQDGSPLVQPSTLCANPLPAN